MRGPNAEHARGRKRAAAVALAIATLATGRGLYVMRVEFPDRSLFTVDLGSGDWASAMAWARATDHHSGWLADPNHAALYGSSVRAAGQRDVLLERTKDTAIAMYDRDVAMRVADRERALQSDTWRTATGARALAQRYDLDYLVVDRPMPLPLAHQSGSLFIYRLR